MAIPEKVKKAADRVRAAIYGGEVQESIASGLEASGEVAEESNGRSKNTEVRQTKVETDFKTLQQEYTENGNGAQTSAEINLARDGEPVLADRLSRDFGNLNAQLEHKANTNEVIKKGYGTLNDFDEETRTAITESTGGTINMALGANNVKIENLDIPIINKYINKYKKYNSKTFPLFVSQTNKSSIKTVTIGDRMTIPSGKYFLYIDFCLESTPSCDLYAGIKQWNAASTNVGKKINPKDYQIGDAVQLGGVVNYNPSIEDGQIMLYATNCGNENVTVSATIKSVVFVDLSDGDKNFEYEDFLPYAKKYLNETEIPMLNIPHEYIEEEVVNAIDLKYDLPKANNVFDLYGDSLTKGTGGGNVSYPSILQSLVKDGTVFNNKGVGGEDSLTIAGRQGGIPMIAKGDVNGSLPMVIPAGNSGKISFKSELGGNVNPYIQGDGGARNVSINGVIGYFATVSVAGNYDGLFYNTDKRELKLNRPATIITENMSTSRNNGMVIWMGTNGGFNNVDELINQHKLMIEYNKSDKYIIIGRHILGAGEAELKAMHKAFGTHFINIKKYISSPIYDSKTSVLKSCYGLEDVGLTATPQDLIDISNNKIPSSLMSDETHFNSKGYEVIANLVYTKGIELGYWN